MKTNDIHIELPYSKSLSNRWLMLNYQLRDVYVLRNLSDADDTRLLKQLLRQLRQGDATVFHCENAGTVARFLLALLAFTPGNWMLTGTTRLCQRPFGALIKSLRDMGANIICRDQEGCLPVTIIGTSPKRKMAFIDPSESSQFVSSLMLVAPFLPLGMTLTLTDRPASRPYIEMTSHVLRAIGVEVVESANRRVYRIEPVNRNLPRKVQVQNMERDWSAAAFVYEAAALQQGKRIRMPGLTLSDTMQGDSIVARLFAPLGVMSKELRSPYRQGTRSVVVEGGGEVQSTVEYNFLDCPDLFPSIAVTCAVLGVNARFKGVAHLQQKESDRLIAIQAELSKMGGELVLSSKEATLVPHPLHPVHPVCTYGDHRIAMAFGILKLRFPELVIEHPEVVSKSFPTFWDQMASLM